MKKTDQKQGSVALDAAIELMVANLKLMAESEGRAGASVFNDITRFMHECHEFRKAPSEDAFAGLAYSFAHVVSCWLQQTLFSEKLDLQRKRAGRVEPALLFICKAYPVFLMKGAPAKLWQLAVHGGAVKDSPAGKEAFRQALLRERRLIRARSKASE